METVFNNFCECADNFGYALISKNFSATSTILNTDTVNHIIAWGGKYVSTKNSYRKKLISVFLDDVMMTLMTSLQKYAKI